jgi:site-specific DNA-methyltransferase (adenine-specific)
LYFVKGPKPAIFHPDRLPIETCRHCGGEKHDYGGYKAKMNPQDLTAARQIGAEEDESGFELNRE